MFDAAAYLATRSGPLLDKLRDADYFMSFPPSTLSPEADRFDGDTRHGRDQLPAIGKTLDELRRRSVNVAG